MEVKPGYKGTEVGVIPDTWGVAPFDAVFRKVPAKNHQIQTKDYQESGAYPVVDQGQEPIIGYSDREDKVYRVPDGGVVIFGDHTCIVKLVTDDFIVGADGTQILAARELQDAQFHAYALMHRGVAATGYNRHFKFLKERHFQVPPPSEQRTIAAVLSDVDALLGGLDRLIAKKRDLKQAAMQQLLTGQTRLPGFSGEWEVKRLGEIAELNRLNVVPANEPNRLFLHFSLPAFDSAKSAQLELGATIGSNKFQVPPNSVLVSKLNPRIPRIWAPEVIPENACASTEWLVLTPREGTERAFLLVMCSSPNFCGQMQLAATGTTGSHQRISPNTALGIRVVVPPNSEEQSAIATVLSDMDAELAVLEARRDKTWDLKQAMMQELLTGKTRLVSAGVADA